MILNGHPVEGEVFHTRHLATGEAFLAAIFATPVAARSGDTVSVPRHGRHVISHSTRFGVNTGFFLTPVGTA